MYTVISEGINTVLMPKCFSLFALTASLVLLLSGCGPNFIVDQSQEIDASGWAYEKAANFSFSIADTQQLYALHLGITHEPDFFAQNIYVTITTDRPDGSSQTDEISLQLADKFGRWYGECGNENCTLDILIQPVAYFDQIGDYTLTVGQHSRKENLEGIQGLRFRIEELEQQR